MRTTLASFMLLVAVSGAAQEGGFGTKFGKHAIVVEAVGADGELLPGVSLEATSTSGQRFSAVTGTSGRATIYVPDAGHYYVRAALGGFSTREQMVNVGIGGTEHVRFRMAGGPVPVGSVPVGSVPVVINPATRASRNCATVEKSFNKASDLQKWMNKLADEHCLLMTIVIRGSGKSIFVLKEQPEATFDYTVLPVSEELTVNTMQENVDLQTNKILRGIHIVDKRSFLMVLSDE